LIFVFFLLLKESAVGTSSDLFVANSLSNLSVKEFWKSVSI